MVKAVRSPHAHAAFCHWRSDGTFRARPGVAAVFTATDIPGRNAFSVIPPFADQPAIAASPARFRGECVALVAFEPGATPTFPTSRSTGPRCPPLDTPEVAEAGAPLHVSRPGNLLIEGRVRKGDAAAALAASAHVVEGTMTTGFVEHAYIEPEAGSAWMEGDTLVIRACTQAPGMDRDDTAAILGLPLERVRIIPSATGGGFGSKLDISLQPLIGLVTLKTGRPCRMVYSPPGKHDLDHQAPPGRNAGADRLRRDRADHRDRVRGPLQHRAPIPAGARPWRTGCRCMSRVPT